MVALVTWKVDVRSVFALLAHVPLTVFIVGVGGYFFSLFISSLRWWLLCRASGIPCTYWRTVTATLIGSFVNGFGLGTVGGDLVRATLVRTENISPSLSLATVAADRLLGLAILAAIGVLSSLLVAMPEGASAYRGLAVLVIGGGIVFWLLSPLIIKRLVTIPKIGKFFADAERAFPSNIVTLSKITGVTVLFHLFQIALFGYMAFLVGYPIPVGFLLAALPIANIAATLPLSWMGLGVRDGLFVLFFTPTIMSKESAILLATLWLISITGATLLGGLLALYTGELNEQNAKTP